MALNPRIRLVGSENAAVVGIRRQEAVVVFGEGKTGGVVLLCGADEKRLLYRSLVLERAGFDVEMALTSAEAAEWLRTKRFGLAVLGSSFSQSARQTLQILCWQSRVPVYELPTLISPEEMIRAVAARVKTRI